MGSGGGGRARRERPQNSSHVPWLSEHLRPQRPPRSAPRLGVLPALPPVVSLAVWDAAILQVRRPLSPLCPSTHRHSDFLSLPFVPSRSLSPPVVNVHVQSNLFYKAKERAGFSSTTTRSFKDYGLFKSPLSLVLFLFLFLPATWSARHGFSEPPTWLLVHLLKRMKSKMPPDKVFWVCSPSLARLVLQEGSPR